MVQSLRISQALPSLNRLRPVLHGELLRAKFTVDRTTRIGAAANHLVANRLTFVMVTSSSESNRVVGMLTERDYMRFAVHADALAFLAGDDPREQPVSKIMTPLEKMTSITPDTTVKQALQTVQHRIFRHLPVVDGGDQLRSIVDIRDLILLADGGRTDDLGAGGTAEELRSVWHGKKAFDVLGAKRKQNLQGRGEAQTLQSYLLGRAGRHTVSGAAPIEAAAKQMTRESLTFLIVLDGHVPVSAEEVTSHPPSSVIGLVNERDFLRYSMTSYGGDGGGGALLGQAAAQPVSSIMTPLKDIVHVSLSDSVSKCVDVLFAHNVRHLPVIDDAHLSGIISLRDILRPIIETANK